MLLYNCQQKEYEKKKGNQKMVTNEKKSNKKKERLIRLSVRVSPKAAETIGDLQSKLGESLSGILRDVIYEGLKAKTKDLEATKSKD